MTGSHERAPMAARTHPTGAHCGTPGHGHHCEVAHEIQAHAPNRAAENRHWQAAVRALAPSSERAAADACCAECRTLDGDGPWCPRCGREMGPDHLVEPDDPRWTALVCADCDNDLTGVFDLVAEGASPLGRTRE